RRAGTRDLYLRPPRFERRGEGWVGPDPRRTARQPQPPLQFRGTDAAPQGEIGRASTPRPHFLPNGGADRSPPRALDQIPSRPLLTSTFTATRRFCALPNGVSLSASGSASAIPVGVSIR